MQTVKYQAGDTILAEGEHGSTAFLIVDGTVDVTVGEGSHVKAVGRLEAGDVFGEMSLIEPGPRSATVTAATDTECLVTTYDEFMASIRENPERAVEFMKTLVRRLRQMNELIESIDPRRRGLREVFRDWQKAMTLSDGDLTDEEKQRRSELMVMGYWGMF